MKKEKKKVPIFVYFIGMIFLFVVYLFAEQIFASVAANSIATSKFGSEALFEIMWAGVVLIVVLLYKNKYIFTQQQEKFSTSIKFIMPEIVLSIFFLFISLIGLIANNNPVSIGAIFNLGIYCLFIGIVEEFLCRGWLLNEFLERYSDTKKGTILSIIFSSFIFGVIHFINIGETQGVFETLVQVMNAASSGIFLALVYYKTKNIWVVVFSHALWDFSLFLSQANSLGDCLSGVPSKEMIICDIVRGLVLTAAYLCLCYWMYVQTDLYTKEKKGYKKFFPIGVVVYLIGLFFINMTAEDYYSCPEYTRKKIEDPYRVVSYNYDEYDVEFFELKLEGSNDGIALKSTVGGSSVNLVDEYYDYLLVDNDNSYSILIQVGANSVLYGNYPKSQISFDEEYLNKVKEGLSKYVVTDINGLGTLSIQNSEYKYPVIKSTLGEYLYFDKDNKIYIDK